MEEKAKAKSTLFSAPAVLHNSPSQQALHFMFFVKNLFNFILVAVVFALASHTTSHSSVFSITTTSPNRSIENLSAGMSFAVFFICDATNWMTVQLIRFLRCAPAVCVAYFWAYAIEMPIEQWMRKSKSDTKCLSTICRRTIESDVVKENLTIWTWTIGNYCCLVVVKKKFFFFFGLDLKWKVR